MSLSVGSAAPEVTLHAHDMRRVSLSDYRGKRLVVLFFPLAFSSTCTAELCTVAEDFATYRDLDSAVVAISVDSPYVLARFRDECGAEFDFLSDFHREAARAFGVLRSEPLRSGLRGVSERAAFVLDPEGLVAYAWVGEHPGLLPPFDEIEAALRRPG